jgi:hypothetical protein
MIYLKAPSLYNTGFIKSNYNDYLRMKQGLMPQNLASDCFSPPDWTSYNVPVEPQYACNGPNMYPVNFYNLSYGNNPPSNACPCTRYVQQE